MERQAGTYACWSAPRVDRASGQTDCRVTGGIAAAHRITGDANAKPQVSAFAAAELETSGVDTGHAARQRFRLRIHQDAASRRRYHRPPAGRDQQHLAGGPYRNLEARRIRCPLPPPLRHMAPRGNADHLLFDTATPQLLTR